MKREIIWFLVAGICAVGTDLSTYYVLREFIPVTFSKGISFVSGSIIAFIINKYMTFGKKEFSPIEILKFASLYLSTLIANVLVNNLSLKVLPGFVFFAFLCATGTSTILNYLGQKFWVFRK
ncbi:GtrA family protein [Leptospira sp. 85282-16]|uniref:GtrA family protein n=1 Tax=Leptospira sp. 85282-16 TaxID=2971256 RepID=UPI0021C21EDB|nr:GtrA family protein [Leptospira sp. 85282-16]MCT8332233.1 GtrA family protein [Leptospira sp. 85282-16]